MGQYSYDYPRPSLTVDLAVVYEAGRDSQILLVQRGGEPYEGLWALPGGFVNERERTLDAAIRELREETGVTLGYIQPEFLGLFDDPNRDPRGWIISAAYFAKVSTMKTVVGMDDAADARWFYLREIIDLAFDHEKIINKVKHKLGFNQAGDWPWPQ